jgi:adenylate cyclase class 2
MTMKAFWPTRSVEGVKVIIRASGDKIEQMEEIEIKFLEVDPEAMEMTLVRVGAEKKYDRIFRDRVFDFPGWPLDKNKSWLRLRDKGDKITLSYKKRFGVSKTGDAGLEEVEIEVDDFEVTTTLLEKWGWCRNSTRRRGGYILNLRG